MSKKQDNSIQVLHVDDDLLVLETSKLLLNDLDNSINVNSVSNVEEAFELLKKNSIDVIVSDYEMPIKNGLDFLKELREKKIQLPFILFTGKGKEEIAIKALNLGADYYIDKIGDPQEVYTELASRIHHLHEKNRAKFLLLENNGVMLENMPDPIAILDFKGNILDINKKIENLIGYKKEELVGNNIRNLDIASKESVATLRKYLTKILMGNPSSITKHTFKHKNGSSVFVELSVFPAKYGEEPVIFGVVRNITQSQKTKSEIEQKYEAFEKIINNIDSGLTIIDKEYNILWANSVLQPVIQIFGGPNKKCYQIFNNLDHICPDCGVKKIFEQNLPLDTHEYETKDKNGQTMWIELRATPLRDKKGVITAALELAIPITERKKVQQALTESEERYRMITENMIDAVSVTDLNGIFMYTSPSLERIYGYESGGLIGKNSFELIHPDDLSNVIMPNLSTILNSENIPTFEVRGRSKSGDYIWLENNVKVTKDLTGETRLIIVSRNIEERKKSEERLAAVNEKLRVVGKLTRHDVRNKLAIINNVVYILKKKFVTDSIIANYLSRIESAIALSNRIFDFTSLYEKIGFEEQKNVDVKQFFDEAVALTTNLGEIKVVNKTDDLTVVADSLLRQVLYNLIDNSIKHGEKITQIKLSYEKEKNQIKIIYEDDGIGIPYNIKPKIFVEGFTTKDGAGLGLPMIKKIMDVYEWSIQETGVPNEGARFEITIPIRTTQNNVDKNNT